MSAREAGSDLARAALFFVLAAVAYTWPLAAHPVSRLAAPVGPGDPYLNLWILGWDLRTLGREPLALLTGRIFDANIFFPAAGTLAYSDHLVLQAIAVWPVWALTGSLTACYNTLLVLSMAASGLSMYVLARAVTGSRAGALVAGLAWGFLPFRFAHLLHLQLQALYFLPLAFLFLHRLVAARRRRDAVLLGAVAGLQAISSVYWGVATGLALVVAAVALLVAVGRWRSLPLFRQLALAAVVGVLVAAPFVWPYWVVQQREGFSRNLYEAARHEAVVGSYLRAAPGNLLYGRTGWLRPPPSAEDSEHEGPEQELFPGFALLALAAYGAGCAWRRDARPLAAAMAAVGIAGFVVSLGPDGVRTAYSALHRFVFGFQAVRAPARFGVLVGFSLAVMSAVGVRELAAGRGRVLPALLVGLVGLELVNVPLPTVPAPAAASAAARWLREAPGPGAVLYLPLDVDAGNTPAMLDSLGHGRPIVNGYSGQRPAFFMALVDTLAHMPSAEALWSLRDLGVRFVVSRAPLSASPLVARGRFDGVGVYELVWTPEAEAALPRPEGPPPPAPGPVPFAAAERAEYRVMWLTPAALGVAAGRALITAEASPPGGEASPGYRVAVEVESADWVKRFFEARDRFETTTDAQLLPRVQAQHLREGRRVVDRSTRFDFDRRTVTIGDGPALPLPVGARDGLAAFLYARTLPLAAGYEATFPVVEGGRQLSAALKVVGEATASVDGRRVAVWRVEARFESRSTRRPIQASLLITRDERRVPVEIRVDAGFGSFRVELVRYASR